MMKIMKYSNYYEGSNPATLSNLKLFIMKKVHYAGLFYLLFVVFYVVTYIVNLVQFFNCDFEAPYKDEIIKGIGVFCGLAPITVWF